MNYFKSSINRELTNCEYIDEKSALLVYCWFFFTIYAPHYIRSDETGTDSAAGKIRHDIKHQIKWLDLSLWLLDTLDYTLHITFYLPENYNIQQPSGPGGTGYHNIHST
jgi:hypothetical protein